MQAILCPNCQQPLAGDSRTYKCQEGDEFQLVDGIVNLLPNITDTNLRNEEKHFDDVYAEGRARFRIKVNRYINSRIFEQTRNLFRIVITRELPDFNYKEVDIGEIGCGDGSAIRYISDLGFSKVNYYGADISIKSLKAAQKWHLPPNWKVQLIRTSASTPLVGQNSLDIAFSVAALHHLQALNSVIRWISKSLKQNGIFILIEPSNKNPFARLGRGIVHGLHTESERPLEPAKIKEMAVESGLTLVYEKGLDFLTGPLSYFAGLIGAPRPVAMVSYHVARVIDLCVSSPAWSYNFIQIYKKH